MNRAAGPAGPLAGRICLVAGAARGLGRGIALGLGESGATVICSGRSTRFGSRTEGRKETIEDTAEAVEAAGGRGYPYVCDHTDARALYEYSAWVMRRFGPPDLVACAVWGGNEGFDGQRHADGSAWGTPIHARALAGYETAIATGAGAFLATARAFVPLMLPAGRGLVLAVGFDSAGAYLGDPWYDLGMAAQVRAVLALSQDLGPHGLAAVHLTPGFVRTERVIDADQAADTTETPLYAGRAVAALAADPAVVRRNGASLHVADLATEYGFTDADGTQPGRYAMPDIPPR